MHEALVRLVRSAPEVVVGLLRSSLGLDVPVNLQPRVTAAELTDLDFAELRADVVFTLGEPVREAFVVEAQGERDPNKHIAWPVYVAGVRARWGCPTTLVVLALDDKVAAWCREPIDLGRGCCVLRPLVIGAQQVPEIRDVEVARAAPELAVLSVAAHGRRPGAETIARAAMLASRGLDNRRAALYSDISYALLGAVARTALEKLMNSETYEYRSPWIRDILDERGQQVMSSMLLRLLRKKFLVSSAVCARVRRCENTLTLMRWSERVLSARRLADVFAE